MIAGARETGTVLEIDAYPDRLDLKDEHVRKAIDAGVKLVIDSDAHSVAHLRFPDDYGIATPAAAGRPTTSEHPTGEAFLARLKGGRARSTASVWRAHERRRRTPSVPAVKRCAARKRRRA